MSTEHPPPPASPAAIPWGAITKRLPFEVARIALTMVIAAAVAVGVLFAGVRPQLEALRQERRDAAELERQLAHAQFEEELQTQMKVLREITTAPTNEKLFAINTQGIGVTEWEFKGTDSVGTTPEAAFATDLTTAQQSNAYNQQSTFHNTDGTDNLCVKPIAWASAGGATCQLKCAAATITCSNSVSTDGVFLQPGQTIARTWDGTSCLCVVGSAAGVTYQTERLLR